MLKYKPIIIKKTPLPLPLPLPISKREKPYYEHQDYKDGVTCLDIYTDGSATGNLNGGYGVFFADRRIPNISVRLVGQKITNNVAELTAMLEAMKTVVTSSVAKTYSSYCIYYDSEYAAGVITGTKRAHANLELVKEAVECYAPLAERLQFKHVYSHTGAKDLHSIGNKIADNLAKSCYVD